MDIGKKWSVFMEFIVNKGRILSRSKEASLIPLQSTIFMHCLVDSISDTLELS